MWWGVGMFGEMIVLEVNDGIDYEVLNIIDYCNEGMLCDDIWGWGYKYFFGDWGYIVFDDRIVLMD